MENNNPAEHINWKEKLNELDFVPGADFNKNAAWDKLQKRMQKKNKKPVRKWYWLAAACLMCLVISFFLMNTPKHTNLPVSQKQNLIPSTENNIAIKKETPLINTEQIKETNTVEIKKPLVFEADKKQHINNNISAGNELPETVINQPEQPVAELQTEKLQTIDSSSNTTAAIIPAKKKLKLVHINELGIAEDAGAIAARNRQILFEQNKLYNNGFATIYELNIPQDNNNNGITIKLNPQK